MVSLLTFAANADVTLRDEVANSRNKSHQQCSDLLTPKAHSRRKSMALFVNVCRRRPASDLARAVKWDGIVVRQRFAKHSIDDAERR